MIVSRDGWVKRQKEVKDLSTTRLREGDSVLAAVAGSTRATMVFFSNFGVAYTSRIVDVPASTGYGDPMQKLFKLKDGERVVARSASIRAWRRRSRRRRKATCRRCTRVAVTSDGYAMRFSLRAVRRGEHALGPPLRAHRRGRRSRHASASRPATKS